MSEISMNLVIQAHTFKNEPLAKNLSGHFDIGGGTIGRAPTNTLCLPDPERHISRLHAEIFFRNGEFCIRNIGSSNPIIINGRVILPSEEASLKGTDDIAMGSYSLRAELHTASTVDQTNLQAVTNSRTVIVPSTSYVEKPESNEEQQPSFAGAPTAPMPLSISAAEPEPVPPAITPIRLDLEDALPPPTVQKPTPQQVAAFSDLLGDTPSSTEPAAKPTPSEHPEPAVQSNPALSAPPPSRPWYKFGATTAAPVSAELPKTPPPAEPTPTPRPQGILRPAHQMAETTMPAVRVSREAPFTINPPKPCRPFPDRVERSFPPSSPRHQQHPKPSRRNPRPHNNTRHLKLHQQPQHQTTPKPIMQQHYGVHFAKVLAFPSIYHKA
jgi:predicted component of type VI protein secretion system